MLALTRGRHQEDAIMMQLLRRVFRKSRPVSQHTTELPIVPAPQRGRVYQSQAVIDRERFGWCVECDTYPGDDGCDCHPHIRAWSTAMAGLPPAAGAPDRLMFSTVRVNGKLYMRTPPRPWGGSDVRVLVAA